MALLWDQRRREVVTALVIAVMLTFVTIQWSMARRVEASPAVTAKLDHARGELYLGETFEGLPLRTVLPFVYSDCEPGKPKVAPVPCVWVKVEHGRVTGGDAKQVARARAALRPVR